MRDCSPRASNDGLEPAEPLEPPAPPRSCPHCGQSVKPSEQFCGQCGSPMNPGRS